MKKQMITQFVKFDEPTGGSSTSEINILNAGEWNHPSYGKMIITPDTISEMMKHFQEEIRKGVYITEGHPMNDEELPAVGWVKDLITKGSDSLYAVVEWNKRGMELLADKAYKFFSPEFYFTYEDPETRETIKNVLTGGALTNKPYFKSLEAVVLSEKFLINNKQKAMLKLEAILAKQFSEVTQEERAFMLSMKEDLGDAVVKKYKLDEVAAGDEAGAEEEKEEEAGEEKKEEATEEKKEEGEKEEGTEEEKKEEEGEAETKVEAAEDKGATPEDKLKAFMKKCKEDGMDEEATKEAVKKYKEKMKMSEGEMEKIQMSEKITALEKENAAFKFKEREAVVNGEVAKVICSETNTKAAFLPKHKDAIQEFALTLSEDSCKKFFAILAGAKQAVIFDESGSGEDNEDGVEPTKTADGTPIDPESAKIADEASKIVASEKVSLEVAMVMAEKKFKK